MSKTVDDPELLEIPHEEPAAEPPIEHILAEGAEAAAPEERPIERELVVRLGIIVSLSMLAAAVMAGGVFKGATPRIYAGLASVAGVYLAVRASLLRRAGLVYAWMLGGLFMVGLVFILPTGFSNLLNLGRELREAMAQGDVLRPPVDFVPGWRAILSWLMACLGFAGAWVALELRRPALGLLVPLPIVAISAISVPKAQQLGSGLASLVLLAVALGVLSGTQMDAGEDDQRPSLSYELRRMARALPLIAGVTVALFFLSKSGLLFPKPLYDPAEEAKRPKSIPLSEVKDRVLFAVEANFTGPWKTGSLDVYDGLDWRLPPFSDEDIIEVPVSGRVDDTGLEPAARADFVVQGLTGAVLPSLPNTVGVIAEGPKLAYDRRNGNIRLAAGQMEPGIRYAVVAAEVPEVQRLKDLGEPNVPPHIQRFLSTGGKEAPPAVRNLLGQAPKTSAWERLDFLRQTLIKNVVAAGAGSPKAVPPSKVQDLLAGSKEGTPFEIVAAQALLARWAGVPSRIGYGFDGGDKKGKLLEVRPKHGAAYIEVYFDGFGWLPIIGDPLRAQESFSDDPTQFNPDVQVGTDVAVKLFFPVLTEPEEQTFEEIRRLIGTVLPIVLLLVLVYYLWPLPYKAFRRGRKRSWALANGPTTRIAVAYSEWRDHCTDYGYRHTTDTPLMFLRRVVPDEEHEEFAWLVTRALWGDLQGTVTDRDAIAAEELAGSLKRRLGQAHAVTLRFVAALSRLSLRDRYAPGLDILAHDRKKEAQRAA